jgi:hypothetical protein
MNAVLRRAIVDDLVDRQTRLMADRTGLEVLKANSSVFDFESEGEVPERYTLVFRGLGLARDARSGQICEVLEHRCDLRLTGAYPGRPPEIRWQTPLLHPNISYSGFIRLADVGLPWDEHLALDAICERLWDVARLAYYDLDQSTNSTARHWLETQREYTLPTDPRPLRDRMARGEPNVFRYQRTGGRLVLLPGPQSEPAVLYLDENTPLPALPAVGRPRTGGDDEILYIQD